MKNNNTILATVHNLKIDNYDPPLELQRTLRSSGALAEIITPYSDFASDISWKVILWKILAKLSELKFFSALIPVLFLLKGYEIYRQIKTHWSGFDRILVYDRISAFAAKKATKGQIPVELLSHYGRDPYLLYMYKYGIENPRLGYRIMQRLLIAIFNQPLHKLLSTS